jgi:cytidylate kinase
MVDSSNLIIAIDGPSGVGKSTISRKLATLLGLTYLDTGAMYRAVALYPKQQGIDHEDVGSVEKALARIDIELLPAASEDGDVGVLLNSADVSGLIRSPEMSMRASRVSAIPPVRAALTDLQRQAGKRGGLVAEGRDTGTVVFPGADFKFFLEATPEERVNRRARQLEERGEPVDEAALLKMNYERDKQDSERQVAPLKKAGDGLLIDTTGLSIDQVLERMLEVIRT